MTTTAREVALSFYDRLNHKDLDAVHAMTADSYVGHGFGDQGGPDALRTDLAHFLTAFPDVHVTVEESIADGDRVAVRSTMTATHDAEFAGFPRSGNRIEVASTDILRIENGKVAEFWPLCNSAQLFQQLGAAMGG